MKGLLLGAAVGYVLGARAGRQRYEQIIRTYRKVIDHPTVQGAAGIARAKAGETIGTEAPLMRKASEPVAHGPNGHRPATDPRAHRA